MLARTECSLTDIPLPPITDYDYDQIDPMDREPLWTPLTITVVCAAASCFALLIMAAIYVCCSIDRTFRLLRDLTDANVRLSRIYASEIARMRTVTVTRGDAQVAEHVHQAAMILSTEYAGYCNV